MTRRHRLRSERGSVVAMVALFALVLISSVLVLFDASRRLNTIAAAQDLASETARFAAATLDEDSVFGGSARIADDAAAKAEVFAIQAGATSATVTIADDGQSVTATVIIDGGDAIVPGFDLTAQGQHRADAIFN